jgi:hypothetical protein
MELRSQRRSSADDKLKSDDPTLDIGGGRQALGIALDAGKEAAEIADELDRTRHAIYVRVQRCHRKRDSNK